MGFLDFLRKKEQSDLAPIIDQETRELRNQLSREKAAATRQRLQMDLANARIEAEIERNELQMRLEESRQQLADLKGISKSSGSEMSFADQAMLKLLDKVSIGAPAPRQNTSLYGVSAGQSYTLHHLPQPTQQPIQPQAAAPTAALRSYSDQELDQIMLKIPGEYISRAKVSTDEQIAEQVIAKLPDIDDDSIERLIAKMRGN